MPFPEAARVVYKKNALDRVICQLRFPPILRIESEPPTSFQEAIRSSFPMYAERTGFRIDLELSSKQQPLIGTIPSPPMLSPNKIYEFFTEDETWKISLTRTFLSITTTNYKRWSDFKEHLKGPYDALIKTYSPAFFTRVGLRYVDVFNRSVLGLERTNWNELFKPFVLGLLSSPFAANVKNFESKYEIILSDDESIARIVTSFVQSIPTNEQCLKIDTDLFSSKRKDLTNGVAQLDFLNVRAFRLLQWVIEEKLHNAMGPQKIEEPI
jgi:uncharacterized protein (TIGR04255 family)